MELKTDKINVAGKIDDLLNYMPSKLSKVELLDKLINRPIINGEKVVGVITDYDIETGVWNGVVWCDAYPSIIDNCTCSVELQ